MIEQSTKVHFPQLPFGAHIPYLEVKQTTSIDKNISDSNELCISEPESISGDNHVYSSQINLTNTDSSLNQDQIPKFRKKKAIIIMSEKAQNFQYSFYQIFTTRKKFQKKFVVMIHNEICCNLNLRRVNRDETRSIYLYFVNFANHAERILLYIKNSKNEIMRRLPELHEIMS